MRRPLESVNELRGIVNFGDATLMRVFGIFSVANASTRSPGEPDDGFAQADGDYLGRERIVSV
jgi:hypothetical protein